MVSSLACGCVQLWSATSVSQIMFTMVDPSANRIWRSVSTTITAEGVKEAYPRTDKEWNDLRDAATALAEAGRLLQKERPQDDSRDWVKSAQFLIDGAAETRKAVDAKSTDGILAAGETIYSACVGCHGGYWLMNPPR
jgi:aconitase A